MAIGGYIAFYKGKRVEVFEETKYKAQQIAAAKLGAKRVWDVAVELAELDGKQVTHMPNE